VAVGAERLGPAARQESGRENSNAYSHFLMLADAPAVTGTNFRGGLPADQFAAPLGLSHAWWTARPEAVGAA
jgi:hypothetical protein